MEPQGQETIQLQGLLKGHKGWVTCIGTSAEDPTKVLSGSRDKTIIVWKLNEGQSFAEEGDEDGEVQLGTMQRRLVGHHHFVQDLDISSDGHFALSASWDKTLRLWDLNSGQTENQFRGHTKDVMSVAFSSDNRQVVSGSRDRTIKLWNVIGECKYTMNRGEHKTQQTSHEDWVTCVRFSPSAEEPVIVSAGCDGLVKVWNLSKCELKFNLVGHKQQINTVTVSPDGSLCASGGKDEKAMLWDLNEGGHLSTLHADKEINALCFSPNRYWLCAACGSSIKIWDLESKMEVGVLELDNQDKNEEPMGGKRRSKKVPILCTSLAWSTDGSTLFAGYTDHLIRVFRLSRTAEY